MKCNKCGIENDSESKYCKNCGKELGTNVISLEEESKECKTLGIIGFITSFIMIIISLPFNIIAIKKGKKIKNQTGKYEIGFHLGLAGLIIVIIKILIFVFSILLVNSIFSNINIDSDNNKVTCNLNERQKAILREVNLSDNCSELSNTNIKRINRIEEMLQHLENKYNKTFHYLGYHVPELLEKDEWLSAYTDELGENNYVKLYGNYEDDYTSVYSQKVLKDDIDKKIVSVSENNSFKVYVTSSNYSGTVVPSNIEDIKNNASNVGTYIIIKGKNISSDIIEKYSNFITSYYNDNHITGWVNILDSDENKFDNITEECFSRSGINHIIGDTEFVKTIDIK